MQRYVTKPILCNLPNGGIKQRLCILSRRAKHAGDRFLNKGHISSAHERPDSKTSKPPCLQKLEKPVELPTSSFYHKAQKSTQAFFASSKITSQSTLHCSQGNFLPSPIHPISFHKSSTVLQESVCSSSYFEKTALNVNDLAIHI